MTREEFIAHSLGQAETLRQAIIDANALPGTDTISFNIAGVGPHTIDLLSALPTPIAVEVKAVVSLRSRPG